MKKLFLFVLSFLSLKSLQAQIYPQFRTVVQDSSKEKRKLTRKPLVMQLDFENGRMMPNNDEVKENFNPDYFNGFNLRLGWQTKKGIYHQLYNYPIYGLGFYASTYKHKEFGNPYAVYGFVSIPIKKRTYSRWNFSYRIGFGLSYNFEPYDEEENPLNILIGSSRNCFIDFGAQAYYTLNRHFLAGAGTSFHHFSNGALRLPNKGLNLIPVTVTLTYIPGNNILKFDYSEEIPPFEKHSQWHVNYALGAKQMRVEDEKRYLKSGLGFYWSYMLSYKWRLGAGMDIFYSATGNTQLYAGSKKGNVSQLFSYAPAFYVDHVLTEKLYLNGGIGVYAHRNRSNNETTPYYERLGIRYKVFKDIYTGIAIKAHGGSADFIEWQTGFSFR